jgi:hypothetical protein
MAYRLAANRNDFEQSLDAGNVYVHVGGERYWLARRNGATKFWKTRPLDWSTPIKMGFRDHAHVTHTNFNTDSVRIAGSRDEAEGRR